MSTSLHCWQCGKQLLRFKSELVFVLVDELRVHKACEDSARAVLHPHRIPDVRQGRTLPARAHA